MINRMTCLIPLTRVGTGPMTARAEAKKEILDMYSIIEKRNEKHIANQIAKAIKKGTSPEMAELNAERLPGFLEALNLVCEL